MDSDQCSKMPTAVYVESIFWWLGAAEARAQTRAAWGWFVHTAVGTGGGWEAASTPGLAKTKQRGTQKSNAIWCAQEKAIQKWSRLVTQEASHQLSRERGCYRDDTNAIIPAMTTTTTTTTTTILQTQCLLAPLTTMEKPQGTTFFSMDRYSRQIHPCSRVGYSSYLWLQYFQWPLVPTPRGNRLDVPCIYSARNTEY